MSFKSDENTRRTFSFPAIRPCESVSYSTLLGSLLTLARTISCYKTRAFFVNKRNARNCIRLVDNFLLFLQEIPKTGCLDVCCTSTLLLSLSELHFIFQKIVFLLEDCAKEDARIWGLLKSEFVANEFQMLMRAIGVSLNVLPFEFLDDVDDELKEIVELVEKQAKQIQFRVEAEDQRILRLVFSIMNYFESGIHPVSNDLRRVLDYLCISSWNDCNKEVKFLDVEIGLDLLTPKKKNVQLLSSLIGLMVYCRGTIFEVVSPHIGKQNGHHVLVDQILSCLRIDDFRCPITMEIMNDPVTISTGHTYDRVSILKWFKAGYPTCPKTGKKLMSTDFVPNFALKQLIRQYCTEVDVPFESQGRSSDISKMVVAASVVGEKAIELLAKFLVCKLKSGIREEQIRSAYEIRMITKTCIFSRSCLVEAGVIPFLLNLLVLNDPLAEENATASLLNLSKFTGSRTIIPENGGLRSIVDVLKEGQTMEAKQHAAGILFYLASVEKYRELIGRIPGCILALTELVRDGTFRAKKSSLITIFGLLVYPGNHSIILAAKIVPLLIDMLRYSCDEDDLTADVLAVLSSLADKPAGAMTIISSGAFPIIENILSSSNSRTAREYCVSLLHSVCIHGDSDVVSVLAKSKSLMAALYSELSVGNSRASKKAGYLIRIIHNFTERSFGFSSPALPHERFVRVS